MDRQQAPAELEGRTLQCPVAPSLAPRRRRPRDLAYSLDTQSVPVTGWRRRPRAAPPMTRPRAERWAAPPPRSSHASCARTSGRDRRISGLHSARVSSRQQSDAQVAGAAGERHASRARRRPPAGTPTSLLDCTCDWRRRRWAAQDAFEHGRHLFCARDDPSTKVLNHCSLATGQIHRLGRIFIAWACRLRHAHTSLK